MDSKYFDIEIAGESLKFQFYTLEYIFKDLQKIFKDESVKKYDLSPETKEKWSQIRKDNINEAKFFSYIKFFYDEEAKEKFGIIGGKTNYNYPDIAFDELGDNDKRFGRIFLSNKEKYKACYEVIVIHHRKVVDDNMLAIFIERYIQRKYNLFDS